MLFRSRLKKTYRELESELMLTQLKENPKAVPKPPRDEMISMLNRAWKSLEIDTTKALKNNFILNSFDGSEDHLFSDKLFGLVGAEMLEFREALLKSQPPSSLQELINSITPPKRVKTKQTTVGAVPPDEGIELLDCDGDEIEHEADVLPEPEIDEDEVDNTEKVA